MVFIANHTQLVPAVFSSPSGYNRILDLGNLLRYVIQNALADIATVFVGVSCSRKPRLRPTA
jgi:hypothetical protein